MPMIDWGLAELDYPRPSINEPAFVNRPELAKQLGQHKAAGMTILCGYYSSGYNSA